MARRHQTLGLDIGHSSVKAAVSSGNGTRHLERVEMLRLPTGDFDRHSILARWIKENNMAGLPTAVTVSGQQVMFQPMFMVPGDPRTVEQAASMEILKLRELAAETMTHGFAPFGNVTNERRVLLAMLRPDILESTLTLVRDVGLEIADIIPAPIALFNALVRQAGTGDTPTIFAHVGHSVTELAVGSASGLMFARSFAGGGQLFTEVLARARQIPVPHAETAKVSGGIMLSAGENPEAAALARAADMWVAEFQSCLAVYNSLFPQRRDRPTNVIMSGGGSLLGGFPAYVQQKTGLTVSAHIALGAETRFDPPTLWPIAASLALIPIEERICPITVLPQRLRDEQVFRRQKPYWIGAAAAAALILGVSVGAGFYNNQRMARELQSQRASLERRKDLVTRIDDFRQRNESVRELTVPVVNLLRTGPMMRKMLSLLAEAKDRRDWITLVCDGESYYAKRPSDAMVGDDASSRKKVSAPTVITDSPTNRVPVIQTVIVEGYTRQQDFSTVQDLIAKLNAAPFVDSADLLTDDKLVQPERQEERLSDTRLKRFVISVKVASR